MALRVSNDLHCWALFDESTEKSRFIFFNDQRAEEANLLDPRRRAVISLSQVSSVWTWGIHHILRYLGMESGCLEKLYKFYFKENAWLGEVRFRNACIKGRITIERVGFSKKGIPKFFVVTDIFVGKGSHSSVFKGFTVKRAEPCAIHKRHRMNTALPLRALELSRHSDLSRYICRLKGCEPGIQASEIGGESLNHVDFKSFDPLLRERIYRSLLEALGALHATGIAHRDIKPDNIVLHRNAQGEIIGVKLIDLDALARAYTMAPRAGSFFSLSYDMMQGYLRVQGEEDFEWVDTKNDLWAAMLVICMLESKIEQYCLINSLIKTRFLRYYEEASKLSQLLGQGRKEREVYCQFMIRWLQDPLFQQNGVHNLFLGIPPAFPLDRWIIALGAIRGAERKDVKELQNLF